MNLPTLLKRLRKAVKGTNLEQPLEEKASLLMIGYRRVVVKHCDGLATQHHTDVEGVVALLEQNKNREIVVSGHDGRKYFKITRIRK